MAKKIDTIADLQGPEYSLIMHDGEVAEMNDQYDQDYGGYIVKLGDGEFLEIWGYEGSVPYLHKKVYEVKE